MEAGAFRDRLIGAFFRGVFARVLSSVFGGRFVASFDDRRVGLFTLGFVAGLVFARCRFRSVFVVGRAGFARLGQGGGVFLRGVLGRILHWLVREESRDNVVVPRDHHP